MDVGGRAASGTKAENTKDIKMKQLTDLPISVFSVYSVVHIYFLKQLWLLLCPRQDLCGSNRRQTTAPTKNRLRTNR